MGNGICNDNTTGTNVCVTYVIFPTNLYYLPTMGRSGSLPEKSSRRTAMCQWDNIQSALFPWRDPNASTLR